MMQNVFLLYEKKYRSFDFIWRVIRLKNKEFFNKQKVLRVLLSKNLYAAVAADGGYYDR